MRLRYVKGARELIEAHPEYIIDNQEQNRIDPNKLFVKPQPLHLEIGMGKGQFVYTLAQRTPEVNYIGIEKFDSAIVKALYKVLEEPLANLYLLRTDAEDLSVLFKPRSIGRIYLNFSDPWPKARHAKRRLTHPRFLRMYETLLESGAEIHLKTDNDGLFAYSLETMEEYGMEIVDVNYDLHQHGSCDIIMTEFEEKFTEQGVPIKHLIARFKEDTNG